MKSTKDPTCARKLREEAIACFQRGLHVTHQMETSTIAALRKIGATIIVAPYEADVELVYLCTIGFCQAVMTEDSDVLVYAAVCGLSFPVLYKFDKITRSVQFLELNSFLPVNDLRTGNDICASIGSSTGDKRNKFPSDKENFHSNTPDESIDAHHSELVTDEKGFLNQMKNYNSSASARRMFVQTCVLAGNSLTLRTIPYLRLYSYLFI